MKKLEDPLSFVVHVQSPDMESMSYRSREDEVTVTVWDARKKRVGVQLKVEYRADGNVYWMFNEDGDPVGVWAGGR